MALLDAEKKYELQRNQGYKKKSQFKSISLGFIRSSLYSFVQFHQICLKFFFLKIFKIQVNILQSVKKKKKKLLQVLGVCIRSMKNVTVLVCHTCKPQPGVEITCISRAEDFMSLFEILLEKLFEYFILLCL